MRRTRLRFVLQRNTESNTSDVEVTVTAATNGLGNRFKPCLRKLWETAETKAAPNGKALSNKRPLASPLGLPEMIHTLATIKSVPE